MHSLCYVSTSVYPQSDADLLDILKQARTRNEADGITGLLLHHDGTILQVLEGDRGAVEACFRRIHQDRRHKGVIRIWSKPIEARAFVNWSMAFVPKRDLTRSQEYGFLDLRETLLETPERLRPSDVFVASMVDNFVASFRDLPMPAAMKSTT